MEILKIDGSYGEGGGQILRSAVTLSCILNKPIEIHSIRKNRKIPGLRAQHLTAIRIISKICNARVEGLEIGSTLIKFFPNEVKSCTLTDTVGTAGSISLILQVLIPAVAIAKKKLSLSIMGGTDVLWSPTINFTKFVLSEAYSRMGIKFSMNIKKRGYFPRGGGLVQVEVMPCEKINSITLSERKTKDVKLFCSFSKINSRKIKNGVKKIEGKLIEKNYSVDTKISEEPAENQGGSILIFSSDEDSIIGVDGLIDTKTGMFPESLAEKFLEAKSVDEHLSDMLILPASLADCLSVFNVKKITKHLETNLFVTSTITGCKYGIGKLKDGFEVRIEGVSNSSIQ